MRIMNSIIKFWVKKMRLMNGSNRFLGTKKLMMQIGWCLEIQASEKIKEN